MRSSSEEKRRIRNRVWDRLESEGTARFPFPPHGRIPNFAGARQAAERLFAQPFMEGVRAIKVNPDAPQLPVRVLALRRGITVYMPTPRLRAGFLRLDPEEIPDAQLRKAASLSGVHRYAHGVPLNEIPTPDLLVVGSVAVTKAGARCGKGEGYADIEYGILRSLGHPEVPVVTTVHESQLVDDLEPDATDLPLSWIVTPQDAYQVANPAPGPSGIDWSLLDEEDLDAMPVLASLREQLGADAD